MGDPDQMLFYAFDLLYLDGFDIRGVSLFNRRKVLTRVIASQPGSRVLLNEMIDEPGNILLQHACEMGLEGILAKRADAPYRAPRPSRSWSGGCSRAPEISPCTLDGAALSTAMVRMTEFLECLSESQNCV